MRLFGTTVAATGLLLSAACGQPTPSPPPDGAPAEAVASSAAIRTFDLPASIAFPEGIAFDAADRVAYLASAVDGTLIRISQNRVTETVAAAGVLVPVGTTTFPAALGMKIDADKRLWIAGGRMGTMTVFATTSRKVVARAKSPNPASLINDVVLVGDAAYFTDTFVPTLWRVTLQNGTTAALEPWLDLRGTPIQYGDGPSLNGIAATPDGRTLIVGQMNEGRLFRIDMATKAVTAIDTGGADLTGIDGLVLEGSRLYVVRQTAAEVAAVDLAADLSRGTVVARVTDSLAWPATAAKVNNGLVVVNSQFNARQTGQETRPFTLSRIPVARLGGSTAP